MVDATHGPTGGSAGAVHYAEIYCDACGRPTGHRILRTDRPTRAGGVRGLARCRECRLTHPFVSTVEATVTFARILSDGPISEASQISLPASTPLELDTPVPSIAPAVRVLRIDRKDGASVPAARADEVATIWLAPDRGTTVPISIVEGRRTRSVRLPAPPDRSFAVGDPIEVEGLRLVIVGLRARGRTWREMGEGFAARAVDRIYARRQVIPPAGRSDWSRSRESPRSFASSTSRSGRVRSSPGARRTRTVPRARRAPGGATVQIASPS